MATNPNLTYGKVTGFYSRVFVDGADADSQPEDAPIEGLPILFTPSKTVVVNPTAKATIQISAFPATTDENGHLVTLAGDIGIELPASIDPLINETGWTWNVTVGGAPSSYPRETYAFTLSSGQEVDLSTVVKLPSSLGTSIVQWEAAVAETLENAVAASEYVEEARLLIQNMPAVPTEAGDIGAEPAGLSAETQTSLSATIAEAQKAAMPKGAALSLTALPTFLYNPVEANSVAFGRSNVVTKNGVQYVAWWNAGRRPMIGKRMMPDGAWESYELANIAGNPMVSPTVDDGHNSLAIAVDSDGYIHVSGNMHNFALRYVRSTTPGNITAWTAPAMVGTNEDSVTYPQFITAGDGSLLFLHRNGGSGNGDSYLNRYNVTTKTWTRVSKLLSGTGFDPTESGYNDQPMVGPDGTIGMFIVWRQGADFRGTHDITYIESTDHGTTWKSIDGANLTLPICPPGSTGGTGSLAPIAFAHATWSLAGLINQAGAVIDSKGRPHTARWLYDLADKSIYRLHHFWHNGTAWVSEVVHTLTGMPVSATGTIAVARPMVITTPAGRTFVVWRNSVNEPGSIYATDVTPDQPRLNRFSLANLDLGGWEPSCDYDAMLDGHLHMLITPTFRDPNQITGDENWHAQWGAILSVDLAQIESVASGEVPVPGLELSRSNSAAVSQTSSTTVTDGTGRVPLVEATTDIVLARLVGAASAATTPGSLFLAQRAMDTGTAIAFGFLPVTNGAQTGRKTPWQPIRPDIEDLRVGAQVVPRYAAGVGGSLTAPALGVETARIMTGSKALAYTGTVTGLAGALGHLAAYWRFSTLGLANDAEILTVPDSSGNGRTLAPASAGIGPLFKTAGINGVPAARFTSNKALKSAAFTLGNSYAFVTVALSDATPADEQAILAAWDSANATPMNVQVRYDNPATSARIVARTALSGTNEVSAPITPTVAHLIAGRRTWSGYKFEYELWIDGVLVSVHAPAPSGSTAGMASAAPWFLGARYSGAALTEYLGGYIGDTMLFDSWLNISEFRAAQMKVARTYGIAMP